MIPLSNLIRVFGGLVSTFYATNQCLGFVILAKLEAVYCTVQYSL